MPNDIANNMVETIHQLEKEPAEAKRLLKLAVEDMSVIANDNKCVVCKHWKTDCCNTANFLDCYVKDRFKWRYTDETKRLLWDTEGMSEYEKQVDADASKNLVGDETNG